MSVSVMNKRIPLQGKSQRHHHHLGDQEWVLPNDNTAQTWTRLMLTHASGMRYHAFGCCWYKHTQVELQAPSEPTSRIAYIHTSHTCHRDTNPSQKTHGITQRSVYAHTYERMAPPLCAASVSIDPKPDPPSHVSPPKHSRKSIETPTAASPECRENTIATRSASFFTASPSHFFF